MKVIKYEGNSNYIIVLYKQNDKLYILYARTNNMSLNDEIEDCNIFDCYENIKTSVLVRHDITINVPLLQMNNNTFFSIVQVDSEKTYDLIKKIVEDLL